MKFLTLLSFTVLALMTIGCEESPAQNKKYGNYQVYEAIPNQIKNPNAQASQPKENTADKVVMHPVMNPKTGQPSMYIPFPASWKLIKGAALGQPAISGPHGLTCIVYPPQSYTYTNNAMMNQSLQSNGAQVMEPVGVEQIMNQVIIPQGQQMGMTLLKKYPVPEIAAKDKEYSDRLNGGSSPQNVFNTIGSDWKDNEGNTVFVLLHYFEMRTNVSINWGYNAELMKVQPSNFKAAKQQYVYAMANKVFNQNDVIAFQNDLSRQIKQQEDHATAMRNIQSEGSRKRLAMDAETNAHLQNNQIAGYENRGRNNDLLQEQRSNALNNVSVVVSPYDGKEYQVASGNKTYWINNEGKYIKSDDPLFDPNKFEDHVGVWKKAPVKVYK